MSDEAKIILKDMQIEEMRKEIISQDQFIAQLEKEYGKEIERLNNIIKRQDTRNSRQRIANDNLQNKNKELNNIIKDIKNQLNYLETYSSKEDVFEDMKRRLDRIESIVNRK